MSINNLRIVEVAKKRNELNGLLLNINHVLYKVTKGYTWQCDFCDGALCKFYGCPLFASIDCNITDAGVVKDGKDKLQWILVKATDI